MADLKARHNAFAANAKDAGAMYQQRYEFETLWNGISVTATPENLARIANNGKGNDNVWTVPNGNYVLKMSVLKANGDRSNPAHWEVWTSSVIRLARP